MPGLKRWFKRKWKDFREELTRKAIALYFLVFAAFSFWVLVQLLYVFYGFDMAEWFKTLPYAYPAFSHVAGEVAARSFLGIFYLFTFSSLFFLPVPLELLFFKFLADGFPMETLAIFVLAGLIAGQHINYVLGRGFGFLVKGFIRKKTRTKAKNHLKKYGLVVVFVFNLLPLPFPLFNFIAGMLRYPYTKWLLTAMPALAIKLLVVIVIYNRLF